MFNLILILCTLRICMMIVDLPWKKYGNDIFLQAFFSMEGEGWNESEVLSFWRKEAALILPAISFTMVQKPERSPKCWCIFCWILKISIDNLSIWFDVERTYHSDRTIHLIIQFISRPFILRQLTATARSGSGSRLVFGTGWRKIFSWGEISWDEK